MAQTREQLEQRADDLRRTLALLKLEGITQRSVSRAMKPPIKPVDLNKALRCQLASDELLEQRLDAVEVAIKKLQPLRKN